VLPAQEGALWAKRAYTQLLCALDNLADEPRQVFILFEIEQLSMEEIAISTGAPLRTCYSRLAAARVKIRAQLKRQEQMTRPVRREVSR
jgi:DNA-directed RNA polymerase specialized sigma24 family protein